ncbi:hypothetical protein GGX14DRAFT_603407 [Mycena pura]|uniref:F-box domain-containing protein n=1 Tax=Mycena pura TaxID=153505 RepID=A0AAD6UMJ5_9AGAR|nr:hypothetical protein GGX14DRAFT_603407 [Mycena pura]
MSTLPFELMDLIIGHIQGDKDALASCSLLSRSWLHSSRPYLFGSVTLCDHSYEVFLRLKASRHCTFISSIKTLSISRPEKDRFSDTDFTKLIRKLTGFPSLTCLRLSYICWTHLSATSVDAFTAVFHDITELDIQHSTFEKPHQLIALLACLPRLEKVTVHTQLLYDETWMQALPGLPTPSAPPGSLQVVRLRLDSYDTCPCASILSWIVNGPPTVRVLKLGRIWREGLPAVGPHLRTLGPVLRELDLDLASFISAREVGKHLAPHLACLPHIAHLTVHVDLSESEPKHCQWYACLALLGALPRAPPALEKFTMVFTGKYLPEDFDWAHLYAEVRAHTRLRLMRFHLQSSISNVRRAMEEIRRLVAPEFAARGSIEVSLFNSVVLT